MDYLAKIDSKERFSNFDAICANFFIKEQYASKQFSKAARSQPVADLCLLGRQKGSSN